MNPEFFEDGRLHEVPGYTTDLLTDRAVGFILWERKRPYWVDPKEGLVAVLMIQQLPNRSDVVSKFGTLVYSALVESRP